MKYVYLNFKITSQPTNFDNNEIPNFQSSLVDIYFYKEICELFSLSKYGISKVRNPLCMPCLLHNIRYYYHSYLYMISQMFSHFYIGYRPFIAKNMKLPFTSRVMVNNIIILRTSFYGSHDDSFKYNLFVMMTMLLVALLRELMTVE